MAPPQGQALLNLKGRVQAGLDSQEEGQLGEASGTVSQGDGSGAVTDLSWLGSSPATLGCWDPYLVWKLAISHTGSLCLSGLICLQPGEKREGRKRLRGRAEELRVQGPAGLLGLHCAPLPFSSWGTHLWGGGRDMAATGESMASDL